MLGDPHFYEFYLWKLEQVLTVNMGKKSPPAPSRRVVKETLCTTSELSVLNKVCPQEKLFHQSLTYWGFFRA